MMLADACSLSLRSSAIRLTCTVVSVIPYMLTNVGAVSARLSYHLRNCPRSSASPPKTT